MKQILVSIILCLTLVLFSCENTTDPESEVTSTISPIPEPVTTTVIPFPVSMSIRQQSQNGIVEFKLTNTIKVKGLQLDVKDEDNFLLCTECTATQRAASFSCFFNDLANGDTRVLFASLQGDLIDPGNDPVFTLKYATLKDMIEGDCKKLSAEKVIVALEGNQSTLEAVITPGSFCVNKAIVEKVLNSLFGGNE